MGANRSVTRVSGQSERILIVESKRGQAARLQRELKSSGYILIPAGSLGEALSVLSHEEIHLVIVAGTLAARTTRAPSGTGAERMLGVGPAITAGRGGADGYELCRMLRSDPEARPIPILLVVSVWEEGALARGLEAGADYFLFTPYREEDLLRSVRNALLNGSAWERADIVPGVEIIYQDRMYTITAGRGRLARALFSVFEDLKQTRSALSWSQAEVCETREQLRRERRQAERGVLLNEMVQGIAHDFSNLLDTVSTAVAVLGSGTSQPAPYRAAMGAALAQAEALVAVLQNFTLFEEEGLTTEKVEPANVVQEVLEAALLPLRAPHVQVRVRAQNLPPIRSNATLLFRCLNNLLWNAVQAMPSGGTLSILGYVQSDKVVLEISDTGTGILEGDQEKIFNSRFTTKNGHSGLGLSLVRSLVRRGGGEITVTNRPGQGTTFALSFPLAGAEVPYQQPVNKGKRSTLTR